MKVNGKLAMLKEGTDYIELKDGTFFTIGALAKIHESAESTIRKKTSVNNIARKMVANVMFYKDDNCFDLIDRKESGAKHLEPAKPYAALSHQVDKMEQTIDRSANVVAEMHGMLADISEQIKLMNLTLDMVVNHLTDPEKFPTLKKPVTLKQDGSEDGY